MQEIKTIFNKDTDNIDITVNKMLNDQWRILKIVPGTYGYSGAIAVVMIREVGK